MSFYQPLSFEDFGRDNSALGFNYSAGNSALEGRKKVLLKSFKSRSETAQALRGEIQDEKSWGIFQLLSPSRDDDYFDHLERMRPLGENYRNILNFGVNAALYTSMVGGAPGYNHGHSIILEYAEKPGSPVVNLVDPVFQKRLINCAFWESVGRSGNSGLAKILQCNSAVLDAELIDEGLRIFRRALRPYARNPNPAAVFDLRNLSPAQVRNYAHFITQVNHKLRGSLNLGESVIFINSVIKPLFKALDELDKDENEIFDDCEKTQIIKDLEEYRVLFD